ncbi:ethyl acetate hydrolase-like [Glandiceps talaboti]
MTDMVSLVDKRKSLHPEASRWLELLDEHSGTPTHQKTVAEARRDNDAAIDVDGTKVSFDGIIREINIPVPHLKGGIMITIYRLHSCHSNPALWVYFHGGGYVLGGRHSVDAMCRMIASQSNIIIINVEYRLAPEFKFPANIEDGVAVLRWVSENRMTVGGSDKSIIGVGGDSAGGMIAANVCHELSEAKTVDFQVLMYPATDFQKIEPTSSELAFDTGFLLEAETREWFYKQFFERQEDRLKASVLKRDVNSLKRQPPCLMVICECDMLRDEGLAYAEKLKQAGRHVEVLLMEKMIHAFYVYPTIFKSSCQKAYKKTIEFIEARVKETSEDIGKKEAPKN